MLRTELVQPLHDLLRKQSARFGQKTAFRDDRRCVSYADLETRSRRIAGHLADLRLRLGDRAAMLMGNRVEMVESYFAIARSGAIGVPVNPRSSDAELAYLLEDSGAQVLITDAFHLDQVRRLQASAPFPLTVLVVGDEPVPPGFLSYERLATSEPAAPACDDLGLDDIAWMLYTSGTTGKPKGVLSTSRNCLWSVSACYVPVLGLSDEDHVLWPLPLFHSLAHIACVLSVTAVGASARIVDGLSAGDVLDIWNDERFTVIAGVPTMYHHLVREAGVRGFTPRGLRAGLVGGAITTAALRRSVEETLGAPLIDAYGSTETCGSITVNWPSGARVEGSCGLPVVGLGVRLVDPATGLDVPDGTEGEVWVRGPNVMAGYHNQPEATAEALKDGWYHTGDLARRDEAGYFTVTGRIKELIIRAGENIHPVEVDEVLRSVRGVADAAVVGRPHDVLGEVPVAFVVPGPEGFDPAEALAVCRERLSYYKVPEELYEIREIPRTASGKITRGRLLELPTRLRAVGTAYYESLLRLDWVPQPTLPQPVPGLWALVGEQAPGTASGVESAPGAGPGATGIRTRAYPDLATLYEDVASGAPVPDVTVLTVSPAAPTGPSAGHRGSRGSRGKQLQDRAVELTARLETWLAEDRFAGSLLVVATRGATATGSADEAGDPDQAALWGLLRSVQSGAHRRLVIADLDDVSAFPVLPAAVASGEPQFSVRSGVTLLPRLARVATDAERDATAVFDGQGTVVVTGADTARGADIAEHLVSAYGVDRLLLITEPGRRGLAAEARGRLTETGADVLLAECDLTNKAKLMKTLAKVSSPIRAVVHAAEPGPGPDTLTATAVGLRNLHALTGDADLSAFVLCSSAAAVTGRGDAGTAASAAFCDAFARHLRDRGVPAVALGWVSESPAPGTDPPTGLLTRRQELAALDAALTVDQPQLVVMRLDAATMPDDMPDGTVPHLLRNLVDTPADRTAGTGTDARGSAEERADRGLRWKNLADDKRRRQLVDLVRGHVAELLALPGARAVAADRTFKDLGFTSVNAVELRNRLSEATGLRLPPTSAFDHPTPDSLGQRLHRELTGAAETTEMPFAEQPLAARPFTPDEPIAIIAMGCRFPGDISSPEDLWRLVLDRTDAVSHFPDNRGWDLDSLFDPDPDHPGTSYTREGGFLYDAGGFDAGFFGISPREALAMDPQQRLMLETSWEALERSGIDPATLRGKPVGVFTGAMHQDYAVGYADGMDRAPDGVEGYLMTGGAGSVLSGRVSYSFGFEGPAVTVDTACSSSLVALHWAAQSLRLGECSLALAGGVTIMAGPESFVGFSRQRGLAVDGRCKAFAAAADGTGWAEGAGVLLLERLSDAERNGHEVLAVVRGSAVNQDGASNGLTAPNGPSQQRVIRKALANAGLSSADVDTVEAHGTGTPLGDPIEAQALLATYGQNRKPDLPLWLGSLKSNIGHTQAAAGVAGVIKMVMAIRHGILPQTLHVDTPTPQVDWTTGAVELLTQTRQWPSVGRPRRAGVSGFGVSGTNAHIILEQAPEQPEPKTGPATDPLITGAVPLVLSARGTAGLAGQANQLHAFMTRRPDLDTLDIARSLALTRGHLSDRAVVVATGRQEALAGLEALANGTPAPGVVRATGDEAEGGTVFVFPGQGAQWAGMGADLLGTSPVFTARLNECARALDPLTGWSLLDVIQQTQGAPPLDRVDVVQPVSWAVMVSLAELWQAAGVTPDAVVGHSQGEIAAACVAGALTLPDAARVVTLRSRIIAADLSGHGGMTSLACNEKKAQELLLPWPGRIDIAAVNGPTSVIVAGNPDALDELLPHCEAHNIRARHIPVDYASHSAHVQTIEQQLTHTLTDITPQPATIPFHSTVTGTELDSTTALDGRYWYRNLRRPVRFAPVVQHLAANGHSTFIEISSHPVLVPAIEETLHQLTTGPTLVTGTLRRNENGPHRLHEALARLHVHGITVNWPTITGHTTNPPPQLPTYAFQHQNYWLEASSSAGDVTSLGLATVDHPLLGTVAEVPDSGGVLFTARWSLRTHPWLADTSVVPASAFVESLIRAGDEVGCGLLAELDIETPLLLPDWRGVQVRVAVSGPDESGERQVQVHSRREDTGDDAGWTRHVTARLAPGVDISDAESTRAQQQGEQAEWVEVTLPEGMGPDRFTLHPMLLEAAARTGLAGEEFGAETLMPLAWRGVRVYTTGAQALRVQVIPQGSEAFGLRLVDGAGAPVASVESVAWRSVDLSESVAAGAETLRDTLFRVEWPELTVPSPAGGPAEVLRVTTGTDIAALASTGAPTGVVTADLTDMSAGLQPVLARTLELTQAWLAQPALENVRLLLVTPDVSNPVAAAVWGLVRSAQSEHPDRFVLLATDNTTDDDTDDSTDDSTDARPRLPAAALTGVLASGEPQIALRSGHASVPRLARTPSAPAQHRPLNPAGTVLITGGTGALGALVARHLVTQHKIRSLVLAGRRGAQAPGAADLRTELTALGAHTRIVACDISDPTAAADLITTIPDDTPLTAVIHTAGVLDDGVITALTPERLETVLRPKAHAAQVLHELTRNLDLAAFVLFSSAAGTFGNPGQGNYAAANAFLDALAQQRRAAGLPATSLAWGYWSQTSEMTAHLSTVDLQRNRRIGMSGISAELGMALLDAGLRAAEPALVPAKLDLAGLRARAGSTPVPVLLRGLVPQGRGVASAGARESPTDLARRLAALTEAEQEETLLGLISRHAAQILGHSSADRIEVARPFRESGFDSLTSVELRNRLNSETGLRLSATLLFDHPNPRVLARHLRGVLLGTQIVTSAPENRVGRPKTTDEPIAIVAMSCRFPAGVTSPEELWKLVSEGVDAVGDFPDDRGWILDTLYHPDPDNPGTSYAKRGAFLDDVAGFDADFFGISPREALAMDPQQRLLLEVSWEAFERAGIDPTGLQGSEIGVFAGINTMDYALRLHQLPEMVEGYRITGVSGAVLSGRISYFLGLEGPAVTVDTACSSSLVTLHLAAQSLRSGECSMALAGGVTVLTGADAFIDFSRQRGLSVDGRCKAFAAAADGTGWAEGAGVLLLERLSDAERNGHEVLAVVRGSAVNQDGASNGLTAPNGPSQQRVIRKALANAGLSSTDVDTVEAHGTGTPLGDPIEAQALLATYGQNRNPDLPLWLGSLKSNIGHTQAAAGVAGVIKMVMAIRHGILPQTLHVDTPTPQVDWTTGAVELLTQTRQWPSVGRPRRAGVSGFGVSGTNAHIILEQAPERQESEPAPAQDQPAPPALPLVLSAKTPEALRGQAARLAAHVRRTPELSGIDLAHSLITTRAVFDHRAVVVGPDRDRLLVGLDALAEGEAVPETVARGAAGDRGTGRLAFLFTGQGSQRVGMGRELHERCPVFRTAFDAVCAVLDRHLAQDVDLPIRDVVFAEPGSDEAALLDAAVYAQTALFALETSLYRLYESWGLRPDILAGHSIGELSAAYAAGVLSLEDAAALVAARARLMQALPGDGAMIAVNAPEQDVLPFVAARPDTVAIAAVNGPTSVVLSGDAGDVASIAAELTARGHKTKQLRVSHAFHSPHMDGMLEDFREVAAGLAYLPPAIPVVSNLTGTVATAEQLRSADYWVDHVRRTVRFHDGMEALHEQNVTAFLELGPDGVLTSMAQSEGGSRTGGDMCVPSLQRHGSEAVAVVTALARLYVRGVPVTWTALFDGTTPRRVELTTYAFQHRRFWVDSAPAAADTPDAARRPARQPLMPAAQKDDRSDGGSYAARLAALPQAEQHRTVLELVRGSTAEVLGHSDGEEIDPSRTFESLGFDSLTGVRLQTRLQAAAGIGLPATLVFDHPTPALLASFLRATLFGEHTRDTEATKDVSPDPSEPIAIVGMACRLPGGVSSPGELWELVTSGRDGITGFPENRGWDLENLYHPDPDHPGTSYAREGGFLHDAGEFDAGFFGISPREALAMDPQQRLMLETSWEALERAGIDPATLRGKPVGVFSGMVNHEYTTRVSNVPDGVEGYLMTGGAGSVLSGRVSYSFGFEGPAVTVDTACSSSLVALHWAAQSLRSGECSMALAGGATVMSGSDAFVGFSRQRGLSVDGRCKAFAAAADGTGWAEGAGVLLLERLSDAERNGHEVLAVVRGSAVNQDGASNGLTAPNGPSQQRVIRKALANAGLSSTDVDTVEAHGTGTPLGDPIEAQALLATYGQNRNPDLPLWLGSLKSNIGHTQAAAGVAGVIKMVMAIRHGILPQTLHVDTPTPQVDWTTGAVELLTQTRQWPSVGRPRRAGVSGFGVSGTNAHIILEQAPEQPEPKTGPATDPLITAAVPLVLSARGTAGLAGQANQLHAFMTRHTDLDTLDIARSLALTRGHLSDRAVVMATDRQEALAGLEALARGQSAAGVLTGEVAPGRLAVLFTGQGSQRPGMAQGLHEQFPVFRDAFDTACTALDQHLAGHIDHHVADIVLGTVTDPNPDPDLLNRTVYTQAALFAVETALFRLIESWGIHPDFVGGHSIGELTAAHVAGILPLHDAASLVAARGRLMDALPPGGTMISVAAPEELVQPLLPHTVNIAAVNGPASLVISGPEQDVLTTAETLSGHGVKTRRLTVSHAFHSGLMDPMLDDYRSIVNQLRFAEPQIPMVSNVTGQIADTQLMRTPAYWADHARHTVRFADSVQTLRRAGVVTYLELGPDAVLTAMGPDCLHDENSTFIPTLRRNTDNTRALLTAISHLHVRGVEVTWPTLLGKNTGHPLHLPTYPFQHRRYWLEEAETDSRAVNASGSVAESDEIDARFWEAVEGEDLGSLAATLGIDAENGRGSRDAMNAALGVLSSWRRRRSEKATINRLRYRVSWKPAPNPVAGVPTGSWLVVVPQGLADDNRVGVLARSLERQGLRSRLVEFAGTDFEATLRTVRADGVEFAGVLSLLALDERVRPESAALTQGTAATLALLRALAELPSGLPVWCVTNGAVGVGPTDPPRAPEQTVVWGLSQAVALEHPDRWGGLVDLPEVPDDRAVRALLGVLNSGDGEDQFAVRSSGVLVRRVLDGPLRGEPRHPERKPRGTVLVTGGTEGLGRYAAKWLAEAGAEHLLLTVDSGPQTPDVGNLVEELKALGAQVTVCEVDLTRREAVAELIAERADRPPLTGVVHAADLARIAPVATTGLDELSAVLSAKADAALHLDELLGDRPLDMFVLFSSVASVWGGGGQGTAAAANAYLDAVVQRRRARGLTATSLAWGVIDEIGMAADPAVREQLRRRGVLPVAPDLAVAVLSAAVQYDDAVVAVADIDWSAFVPAFTSSRPSMLLGDLPEVKRVVEAAATASAEEAQAGSQLVRSLAEAASETEQTRILIKLVRERAAEALGHSGLEEVKPRRAFQEMGFDSLAAVTLRNALASAIGTKLPATLIFDYPTPAALVEYLREELLGSADDGVEGNEEDIRRALASVPLEHLRGAGVLDTLLSLARSDTDEPESGQAPATNEEVDLIDAMDVADLVQRAMGNTQS